MALIGKREDLIHVPWSSTEEWLKVYKQIYSGDLSEQTQAHETLLVWKARIPKLPVGVECTLGLIQVCLRDREWGPKILTRELPLSYENDLRIMYSNVIMKFLNHISNIAHNNQTSLFTVAKQMNIPEWIVDLRHTTAHSHELPSVDVMRVVANILLTWVHEEYWAAEIKHLEESLELEDSMNFESGTEEKLIDLIELWTAVGLYIKTNHATIADLPDIDIRKTLKLFESSYRASVSFDNETNLSNVQNILLSEISNNLNKGDSHLRKEKIVIDSILSNEAFLTNSEILAIFVEGSEKIKSNLPASLIEFWKDIFLMLQDKKILILLFLELLQLIKTENSTNRKLLASLWIKVLAQAFHKQKVARNLYQIVELKTCSKNGKLPEKVLIKLVQEEMYKLHPELENILNLKITGDFPNCLLEEAFVKRLVLHPTEFAEYYIPDILKISLFLGNDTDTKEKLLTLIKKQSLENKEKIMEIDNVATTDKIYTVEDLKKLQKENEKTQEKIRNNEHIFADEKIRNSDWEIVSGDDDWNDCPIGVLPMVDYQMMDPLIVSPSEVHYAVLENVELPKIIDSKRLRAHSKIQWDNLVKKKKRTKKKAKSNDKTSTTVNEEDKLNDHSTSAQE